MIDQIALRLSALTQQQLQLAAGVIVLVAAALGWFIVKMPVSQLQLARTERINLEQASTMMEPLSQLNAALTAELERFTQARPQQKMDKADQVIVDVLGLLNRLSKQYKVSLNRVSPGVPHSVMMFEEIVFDVEVSGNYREAMEWLLEVEQALPQLAVIQFDVTRPSSSGTVLMRTRLAVYIETERKQ